MNKSYTLLVALFLSTICFGQWVPTSLTSNAISAIASSGNRIYAGEIGGMYLSVDSGKSFKPIKNGLPKLDVNKICILDTNIFISTTQGIYKSSFNDTTWVQKNNGLPSSLNSRSINYLGKHLFASFNSGVYHSSDLGNSWTSYSNGLPTGGFPPNFASAIGVSGGNLYTSLLNSGTFVSSDTGLTWNYLNTGIKTTGHAISIQGNGTDVYAVLSNSGGIFHTTNTSSSWTNITNQTSGNTISDIIIYGYNQFAGGTGFYISTDNGLNWSSADLGLPAGYIINGLTISGSTIYAGLYLKGVWKRDLNEVVTSIKNSKSGSNVSVFPNPTNTILTIQLGEPIRNANYKIYDALGKQVLTDKIVTQNLVINFENIPNGLYFLEIQNGNDVERTKVIKN